MTELEILAKIILEITDDKENLVYVKKKTYKEIHKDDKCVSIKKK